MNPLEKYFMLFPDTLYTVRFSIFFQNRVGMYFVELKKCLFYTVMRTYYLHLRNNFQLSMLAHEYLVYKRKT